jgi:predicted CxxxxCH...CXXCH cytochrome family protein
MKLKTLIPIFALVVLMAVPALVAARTVHDFECSLCHKPGANLDSVASNICLECHTPARSGESFPLRNGGGNTNPIGVHTFLLGDASDAMGSVTAAGETPGDQTSHNWAASDTNPAAGASAPSDPAFYGRANYAGATVSCARCHNPHAYNADDLGPGTANPKLLKLGANSADAMCVDCHVSWNTNNANALLTHPLVQDYPTFQAANADKYKPFLPNGGMALKDGTDIVCSTCHGTHYTDSDAATLDGAGNVLSAGDGYLLKGNGRLTGDAVGVCSSCHIYNAHGATGVGCLDCHSGHSYNNGNPNYFVLRDSVALDSYPAGAPTTPGTNLSFTSANADWKNAGNGYCEGCHTLAPSHNGVTSGGNAACASCHQHYNSARPSDLAFTPSGACDTCHGYPPVADVAGSPNGYAVAGANDYSTDTNFKSEATTGHAKHAGTAASEYAIACSTCHAGYSHNSGSFQDVFITPSSFVTAGVLTPTYAPAGNGTCAAVYCHSNGGPRSAAPTAAAISTWAAGTATSCNSCHGNDAATMTAAANSATHQAHLAKGYSCAICHSSTAADATTLAAGAIQGSHVNGTADVAFSGFLTQLNGTPGSYNAAAGTCSSVYCHSDGANNAPLTVPDWDDSATGSCGSCHDVTGETLPDAHNKHVFAADGPQLACTVCHTNSGSGSDHVNQFVDTVANLQLAVCNSCHGVDGAEVAPIWKTAGSDDCVTCHSGSALSTIGTLAPDKTLALSKGHNLVSGSYSVSNNPAANKTCADCHDKTAAHLSGSGNLRLKTGFSCTSCHSTMVTHQAQACSACHDPHGTGNIYMVKTNSTPFSGSVVFTGKTGTNSYDEADSVNGDDICATCHTATTHNLANASGPAHNEGNGCIPCHLPHTETTGAFGIGAGTTCDGCHGFPPADTAHQGHNITTGNEIATSDRSDCAVCHTGADSYTYDPSADQGNSLNHSNVAGRVAALVAAVGFDNTAKTCAGACHSNGAWTDTTLDCASCHYYAATPTSAGNTASAAALTGTHNQHFDASRTCTDCHAAVTDLSHISLAATGTDAEKIQGKAVAEMDEAEILGTVGIDTDPGNASCSASCHNPSGTSYSATWNVTVATCTTCHSSTDPATNNHSAHLSAATTFGLTIGCNDCHIDNAGNLAHFNGTVNMAGEVTAYAAPNCTNNCHQDGRNGAAAVSATWGMAAQADCTICHTQQPATGSHAAHLAASASCADCHDNTVEGASAATQHLDLNVDAFDATPGDLGYPADKALNSAFANCTTAANCHTDGTNTTVIPTPIWGDTTSANCTVCHTTLTNDGPATGSHVKHLASAVKADITCGDCHAAGTDPATNSMTSAEHRDGNIDTLPALQYGAGPDFTNKAIGSAGASCTAAICHDNGLGAEVTTPAWGDTTVPACTSCHELAPTTGSHTAHLSNTEAGVIACGNCHSGAVQGTTPPTTGHDDGNVDVANGYPANVAWGTSTWTTCTTASCHNNGQSADGNSTGVVVETPAWGSAPTCNACHAAIPTSAKHSFHLGSVGSACGDCHDGAVQDTSGGANHRNGVIDVRADVNYSMAGAPGNGWGSCGTVSCHSSATARDWNDAITTGCVLCHGASGTSGAPLIASDMISTNSLGQHNKHVLEQGFNCNTCHNGNNMPGTIDDKITISFTGLATGGSYNPPAQWDATNGKWLYDQTSTTVTQDCSNLYCHSTGQSADGTSATPSAYSTPDWGNASSGVCGTCHSATDPATGSHSKHVTAGSACTDCHGGNNHVNQLIDVSGVSYTAGGAPGNGYGTCSTASCHDNGRGVSVTTSTWGASVTDCTECHAGAGINTGSHSIHLGGGATCTDCHASGTNPATETSPAAGHRDTNIDVLSTLGYPQNKAKGSAFATCTASCHVTNRNTTGVTSVWGSAAVTNCTECHTTPPSGDSHTTHLNAKTNGQTGLTIGCADCHDAATNVSTQTAPAAGHRNDLVNAAGGYPAKAIGNAAYLSCDAAVCHQTGQAPASYVTTSNFNIDDANCTQCHTNAGLSPSHGKHIVSSNCSACHAGADNGISYSAAAHGDGNVDVAVGGYSANKAYGAAKEGCASISCHSDGLSGTPGDTPIWGTAAGCDACHRDDTGVRFASGSHDEHLQSTLMVGIVCADCHTNANPATSTPPVGHADGNLDVIGYDASDAAIGSGSWTTCSTASCHDTGTGTLATTPAWGSAPAACTECHAAAPATNAHSAHLSLSGVTCGTCHAGAVQGSNPGAGHLNNQVDVLFGYSDTTEGAPYGTCSTSSCHNDGQGNPVASPAWNSSASCSSCHTTPPATGSHGIHLTNTEAGTISCGACHGDATTSAATTGVHANNNVDVFDASSGDLGYPTAVPLGSAGATCNAASCHDNGTGTLVTTPSWGTNAACTECHTTVPATGAHTAHLTQTITSTIACTSCHAGAVWSSATPTSGHRDGDVDVTGGYGYPLNKTKATAFASCNNSYCHGEDMPNGPTGTTNAPSWGASSSGCTFCHEMAPSTVGAHSGKTATDCISCHDNTNAAGTGFSDPTLHINGTVEGGGDSCSDCHSNVGSGLSGAHAAHNTQAFIGLLSNGDYGSVAAGWYAVTYTNGVPSFGCGYCHPSTVAGHMTKQTSLSPADAGAAGTIKALNNAAAAYNSGAGTCSATYCHSDGANVAGSTSPAWNTTISGSCNDCHGNSPTTNAHSVHAVGIHYTDLYDSGRTGLMQAAAASDAAHGNAATSTSITCYICHADTLTPPPAGNVNDANELCITCHTGGAIKGNMGIATTSTTHINGQPDVAFNLSGFKTTAQLRDDITGVTELDTNWTRTNGYKVDGTSHDSAKAVTPGFVGGSCSAIVCHNGNSASWTDPVAGDCQKCHTELPK